MVDEGMFNAARITKAAGTYVYKGPHTEDRPNRQSKVLHFASKTPATESQVTEIANEYISVPGEFDHFNPNDEIIDDKEIREKVDKLKSYLDYYDVTYQSIRQNGDNIIYHVHVQMLLSIRWTAANSKLSLWSQQRALIAFAVNMPTAPNFILGADSETS